MNLGTYLVTAPLNASKEKDDTRNRQEASDVVNAPQNLLPGISLEIRAWRRAVEDDGEDKTDKGPDTTEETDVAEAAGMVDELSVHDRRGPRSNCEDHAANPETALARRSEF